MFGYFVQKFTASWARSTPEMVPCGLEVSPAYFPPPFSRSFTMAVAGFSCLAYACGVPERCTAWRTSVSSILSRFLTLNRDS
jgi:hypothetical protein